MPNRTSVFPHAGTLTMLVSLLAITVLSSAAIRDPKYARVSAFIHHPQKAADTDMNGAEMQLQSPCVNFIGPDRHNAGSPKGAETGTSANFMSCSQSRLPFPLCPADAEAADWENDDPDIESTVWDTTSIMTCSNEIEIDRIIISNFAMPSSIAVEKGIIFDDS